VVAEIERAASELGEHQPVPRHTVERIASTVDEHERRRLLRLAETATNGSWSRIRAAIGPAIAEAEDLVVMGVVEAAIVDRLTCPEWIIRAAETAQAFPENPAAQLAIVLLPQSIWSIDEAFIARAAGRSAQHPDLWPSAVGLSARMQLRREHLRRLRALLPAVERVLPVADAPRVSRAFADACARARTDDLVARHAAECLLITYVAGLEGMTAHAPSRN
jgi:hypothetical protein